jgi:lipopolysaccharide transport system ATP-binding protein
MSNVAIHVENLGKQYFIGGPGERTDSIRELIVGAVTAPFIRAARLLRGQASAASELHQSFWALNEVSFDVPYGEVIGIVGRNGAGKSTLLKILSRITEPDRGLADIHGRVGSLLEVGTGFHPELTGRENIFLNGAVMGMRRVEIARKFDEIAAFSEVEKFIDMPVKHYSSGMYLRLAFAVAAHLEPEILLVDEVLAVGDAAFQRKCLGKMDSVARQGRTVLFVSHNMAAVTQLCHRAVWLVDGRVQQLGAAGEVVAAYLSAGTTGHAHWHNHTPPAPGQEVHFATASLLGPDGQPTPMTDFDRPYHIEVGYDILRPARDLSLCCQVFDTQGNLVFETIDTDMPELKGQVREPGHYGARVEVAAPLLKPGRYHVTLVSFIEHVKIIQRHEGVLTFDVTEVGYRLNPGRMGIVAPVLAWEIRANGVAHP